MDHQIPFYINFRYIAGTGVAYVKAGKPFRILVASFGNIRVTLLPHQVVATSFEHPEPLVEYSISHAEVFGLIADNSDTKYRKKYTNSRDINTIDKNLAYNREQHMSKDENPVTSDNIDIEVPYETVQSVRDMLRKHEYFLVQETCRH